MGESDTQESEQVVPVRSEQGARVQGVNGGGEVGRKARGDRTGNCGLPRTPASLFLRGSYLPPKPTRAQRSHTGVVQNEDHHRWVTAERDLRPNHNLGGLPRHQLELGVPVPGLVLPTQPPPCLQGTHQRTPKIPVTPEERFIAVKLTGMPVAIHMSSALERVRGGLRALFTTGRLRPPRFAYRNREGGSKKKVQRKNKYRCQPTKPKKKKDGKSDHNYLDGLPGPQRKLLNREGGSAAPERHRAAAGTALRLQAAHDVVPSAGQVHTVRDCEQ